MSTSGASPGVTSTSAFGSAPGSLTSTSQPAPQAANAAPIARAAILVYPDCALADALGPRLTVRQPTLFAMGALDDWTAVGPYEYTRVNLVTSNFQDVGACSNGRHEMTSEAPFGVTVWGWGTAGTQVFTQYVSYAYPAGLSLAQINDVVIEPQ